MGFLLVRERLVDPQELREALRLQISRIVYAAFRWPDGRFRFSQEGEVDYDADHMAPVSTDTVLMEAAQIVDEWPLLEKKVGRDDRVYPARAGSGGPERSSSARRTRRRARSRFRAPRRRRGGGSTASAASSTSWSGRSCRTSTC